MFVLTLRRSLPAQWDLRVLREALFACRGACWSRATAPGEWAAVDIAPLEELLRALPAADVGDVPAAESEAVVRGVAGRHSLVAKHLLGSRFEDDLPDDWEERIAQRSGTRTGMQTCCGWERVPRVSAGQYVEQNGFLATAPECAGCRRVIPATRAVLECLACGGEVCARCAGYRTTEPRARSRSRSR